MASLSHTPHLLGTRVGTEFQDPMGSARFAVEFTLPNALQGQFTEDVMTLSEQVTHVSGLDALQMTVQAGHQKFLGVDISFLNPAMDHTYAEITVELNLNIRNVTDAWAFKIFKAWEKLGYDLADGSRVLKQDYVGNTLRISEANRDGTIWRAYTFNQVMVTNVTGADSLDYTDNEPRKLSVTFLSDYWDEDLG